MFGLGIGEVIVIMIFALIFIGPKKLPDLAKGIGKGLREFQNASRGIMEEVHKSATTPSPKEAQPTPIDHYEEATFVCESEKSNLVTPLVATHHPEHEESDVVLTHPPKHT